MYRIAVGRDVLVFPVLGHCDHVRDRSHDDPAQGELLASREQVYRLGPACPDVFESVRLTRATKQYVHPSADTPTNRATMQ